MLSVRPSPDGCITHAALSERVQRWLERERVRAPPRLEVAVDGAREPIGFELRQDGETVAERHFAVLPAGCGDRLDALALAIAVAVEHAASAPTGDAGSPRAAPAAAGAQPAGAAPPQPTTTTAETSERASEPRAERTGEGAAVGDANAKPASDPGGLRVDLFAGGAWLIEALPAPVLAVAAGGGVHLERLRLELGFLLSAEHTSALGAGESRLQLVGGRAHACLGWPSAGLELAGCAGIGAGAALAQGDGYFEDRQAEMPWVAALLRAALRYPAGSWLSGRIAVDGLLNLLRPELQVEGQAGPTDADPTFPLGAALSLELVVALP